MKYLRTPDDRFANLADYNYAPNYVQIDPATEMRMHYIDEGPRQARPVLLLHGEPVWCYSFRKTIPILVAEGHRVIAPDLIGLGRSDKPVSASDYSYQSHVDWMAAFVQKLDLKEITMVCHDWGGLIGLRVMVGAPDRFARTVLTNADLPTGDSKPSEAFMNWRNYSQTTPDFRIGEIMKGFCPGLTPDGIAAYDAPFPDDRYKVGARVFPALIPLNPSDQAAKDNRAAWQALQKWSKPLLTAFSDGDPVTRGEEVPFQTLIPGAKGQPHVTIKGAGHYPPEEKGEELAAVVVDFIRRTSATKAS